MIRFIYKLPQLNQDSMLMKHQCTFSLRQAAHATLVRRPYRAPCSRRPMPLARSSLTKTSDIRSVAVAASTSVFRSGMSKEKQNASQSKGKASGLHRREAVLGPSRLPPPRLPKRTLRLTYERDIYASPHHCNFSALLYFLLSFMFTSRLGVIVSARVSPLTLYRSGWICR